MRILPPSLTLLFLIAVVAPHTGFAKSAPTAKHIIHWQLAHWPFEYFDRTAADFKRLVEEGTGGSVSVKTTRPSHENEGSSYKLNQKIFARVRKGDVDMAQVYTMTLTPLEPEMHALNLPFIFRDNNHVTNTVEGEIGQYLLAGLRHHNLEGLAFTYSGGFVGACNVHRKIRKFEDFRGLRYRSATMAVNRSIMQQLQVVAIESDTEFKGRRLSLGSHLDRNITDGGDCTFADALEAFTQGKRRRAKVLNLTGHRVLMTALVISQKKWQEIPEKYHAAIRQAAKIAARNERKLIVEDGKRIVAKLRQMDGVEVVRMSDHEKGRMREALEPVYRQFAPIVGPHLIRKIRRTPSTDPHSFEDLNLAGL